jgi:hypothetical protein
MRLSLFERRRNYFMRRTVWIVLALTLALSWTLARFALAVTGAFLHLLLGLALIIVLIAAFRSRRSP